MTDDVPDYLVIHGLKKVTSRTLLVWEKTLKIPKVSLSKKVTKWKQFGKSEPL